MRDNHGNDRGLAGRNGSVIPGDRRKMLLLDHLQTLRRARLSMRTFKRGICFASCMVAVAGAATADPKNLQCWDCVQRLAMELPAVNSRQDESYEQGLTPGSVLPAFAQCSLDDGDLPVLRQIIKIFTDALAEGGGAAYVRDHLARFPQVSADDRAKLVDGAAKSLDTTLQYLVDHNCRILLQSHFDEGASRAWILQMVELGRKLNEAR
jgi:hypothetical protein